MCLNSILVGEGEQLLTWYPGLAAQVNDYSILYTWQGADPLLKPLLLLAHIDIVPAPTEGSGYNWTYPPFSGTVADG